MKQQRQQPQAGRNARKRDGRRTATEQEQRRGVYYARDGQVLEASEGKVHARGDERGFEKAAGNILARAMREVREKRSTAPAVLRK